MAKSSPSFALYFVVGMTDYRWPNVMDYFHNIASYATNIPETQLTNYNSRHQIYVKQDDTVSISRRIPRMIEKSRNSLAATYHASLNYLNCCAVFQLYLHLATKTNDFIPGLSEISRSHHLFRVLVSRLN